MVTLGCSKNVVDSEYLMGQLRAAHLCVGHEETIENPNIVVINTCGFINDAKQESIDTILAYVEAKEAGELERVYVMGCLSERYREALLAEIPGIDGICGVGDFSPILADLGVDYKSQLVGERQLTTPPHFAYLKVSEGCDRSCAFCAIPMIRGRNISKPIPELVDEARKLVKGGVKELILIAQDLTYYGVDLYKSRKLGELVRQLSAIEGLEWIRLHYTYPSSFPKDVITAIRELPNVCKYIDIPLQHISSDLLSSMKRGIDAEGTRALVDSFRKQIPGVALRTTLIVGYPGETDAHFQELKAFVKAAKFERLGVFTYSPEEGTPAYELGDPVPEDVKEARMAEIMEMQEIISQQHNQNKVGSTYKVLIDRMEGDYFVGRTEFDSPEVDNEVLIDAGTNDLIVGEFAQIRIVEADSFDLFGEKVSD